MPARLRCECSSRQCTRVTPQARSTTMSPSHTPTLPTLYTAPPAPCPVTRVRTASILLNFGVINMATLSEFYGALLLYKPSAWKDQPIRAPSSSDHHRRPHLVRQLGDEAWLEGKTGIAIEHYTSEVVRRQRNQRRRRGEADSYDHARAILVLRGRQAPTYTCALIAKQTCKRFDLGPALALIACDGALPNTHGHCSNDAAIGMVAVQWRALAGASWLHRTCKRSRRATPSL